MRVLFHIIILAFFWSLKTQAKVHSTYVVGNEKFKINIKEYNRYVRPQIKSIVKDFNQILRKININNEGMLKIKSLLELVQIDTDDKISNCKSWLDCQELINQFYNTYSKIDAQFLQLYLNYDLVTPNSPTVRRKLNRRKRYSKNPVNNHEAQIFALNTVMEMGNKSYKVLSSLEQGIFKENLHLISNALKLHNQFKTYINIYIMDQIPLAIRANYRFVWVNFIQQLNKYIVMKNNKMFLESHIGDLNLSWNDYRSRLLKGKYRVDSNVLTLVQTIHNRWNMILRIILN